MFSNSATFPSDFRVNDIGEKGSNNIGDSTNDPELIIILKNYASKKSIKTEIKNSEKGASYGEATGFLSRVGMFFLLGLISLFRLFGIFNHMFIIPLIQLARHGQNASFLV